MRKANDIKYILRFLGIMLMAEGVMMLSCLIPALHFNDGTWWNITVSGLFTFNVGLLLFFRMEFSFRPDERKMYEYNT